MPPWSTTPSVHASPFSRCPRGSPHRVKFSVGAADVHGVSGDDGGSLDTAREFERPERPARLDLQGAEAALPLDVAIVVGQTKPPSMFSRVSYRSQFEASKDHGKFKNHAGISMGHGRMTDRMNLK